MAYKPLDVKIIPAGMNLLAPGDQVSPGDCLDLTGWWPGSVGRLQQTPGLVSISDNLLNAFDGVEVVGQDNPYYGGHDAAVTTGTLYQVGHGGDESIDTGYDGYPLGLLSYQGYLWVMNRAKQRKVKGSVVSNWSPSPPGPVTCTNPDAVHVVLNDGVECDPTALSGSNYTKINFFTNTSVAGVQPQGSCTITGSSVAAYLDTFTILEVFETPGQNLLVLSCLLPSTTAVGMGGSGEVRNVGMPQGKHDYYATWQLVDLGESNPSTTAGVVTPTSVTVGASGTLIQVTRPASPPAEAIGWNVYRQSPDMPSPYLINPDPIPIAQTTYNDYGDAAHFQDSDSVMNSPGRIMQGDRDAAPAARIMANDVFKGRIVVANSAQYPNRVWYTPALEPAFFPGANNPIAGNWVDIGTDREDEILFLSVKISAITVYRRKSIWRILGDFEDANSRVDPIVQEQGIVGPRAVAPTSVGDYCRCTFGLYVFTGDWLKKLSVKIDPIFRGGTMENFSAEVSTRKQQSAVGYRDGRAYVSYASTDTSSNESTVILDVANDRWFARTRGFGAYLDTGARFYGPAAGHLWAIEENWKDGTQLTQLAYQSAYEDAGLPDHEKTWSDLVISHNLVGGYLSIIIRTNKNADPTYDAFILGTTSSSSSLTKETIPLVYPAGYPDSNLVGKPIRSYNLSVRLVGQATGTGPAAYIDTPILLHYYLEARKGKVYDTDETDHGMPTVVKTVDEVEFDIDASAGAATLQIYSDVPGGSMSPRLGAGLAVAQTAGRRTIRLVLPSLVEGKLLRYVVTTPTSFCVYGFRVRVTPIGTFIDGEVTEIWAPQAMGV